MGTNLCAISIATLGTGLVLDLTTIPPRPLVAPFTPTICEMVPKAVYQHHATRSCPTWSTLCASCRCPTPVLWFFERVASLAGGDEGQRQVRRADIQPSSTPQTTRTYLPKR